MARFRSNLANPAYLGLLGEAAYGVGNRAGARRNKEEEERKRAGLPDIDPNDPNSIIGYAQYMIDNNLMKPEQMGYYTQMAQTAAGRQQQQNAAKQLQRKTDDAAMLAGGVRNTDQQIERLESNIETLRKNGTPEALQAAEAKLGQLRTANDEMRKSLQTNPDALKLFNDAENADLNRENTQLAIQKKEAELKAAEVDARHDAKVAGLFNGYLTDPSKFAPDSPAMKTLQATDPEAYKDVNTQIDKYNERVKKHEKAVESNRKLTREEFGVFGPQADKLYEQYEAEWGPASNALGGKAVNKKYTSAMTQQLKANVKEGREATGEPKPYKWTDDKRTGLRAEVKSLLNNMKMMGKDAIVDEGFFYDSTESTPVAKALGKLKKDKDKTAFVNAVVSYMENNGIDPRDKEAKQNAMLTVLEEYHGVDTSFEREKLGGKTEEAPKGDSSKSGLSAADEALAAQLRSEGYSEAEIAEAFK